MANDFGPQEATVIVCRREELAKEVNNLLERVLLLFHRPARAELSSALSFQSPLHHRVFRSALRPKRKGRRRKLGNCELPFGKRFTALTYQQPKGGSGKKHRSKHAKP